MHGTIVTTSSHRRAMLNHITGTSQKHFHPATPRKSREILIFVGLQRDAKQCCNAAKRECTHCDGLQPTVIDQHNQDCPALWHQSIVMGPFGDKQTLNLRRLRLPIAYASVYIYVQNYTTTTV